jgi:predicted Zn-dependent peptidase
VVSIKKSILKNGITVVTEAIESVRSISLGFWIVVGSRNEENDENGISHFIEHVLFKGTQKRNSKEIAQSLESKGASLDAFTGKEVTCFFSRGLDIHLRSAVNVICDIITNPVFPPSEIKKERGVVIEEIKDSEDSTERYIFDLLFKKLFTNHPLAKSVLGEVENIEKLTRKRIRSYFDQWYTPERIVVSASGNLDHGELVRHLNRYYKKTRGNGNPYFARESVLYTPFSYTYRKKGILQSHLIMATTTFDYRDRRRYPLLVLDVILGDGMSSVLFQRVREERGLVYEISSFSDFFSDGGIFGVYLASEQTNIERSQETIMREFRKIARNGVSRKLVQEAKTKLKAKLIIGQENTSNRMLRLGKGEIYLGRSSTIDTIIKSINRVRTKDVNSVAREVLDIDGFSFLHARNYSRIHR